jgi:hypothetical protein
MNNQDFWDQVFIYCYKTNNPQWRNFYEDYYREKLPKGMFVYGDSLTSPQNSWANLILKEMDRPHIQVQAMPGMIVAALDMLEWQRPTNEIDTVMVFMGTNDAGSKQPKEQFIKKIEKALAYTRRQHLKLIWVQIPPNVEKDFADYWSIESDADYSEYRSILSSYQDKLDLITIETHLQDSPDGLHMGDEGQREICANIIVALSKLYPDDEK